MRIEYSADLGGDLFRVTFVGEKALLSAWPVVVTVVPFEEAARRDTVKVEELLEMTVAPPPPACPLLGFEISTCGRMIGVRGGGGESETCCFFCCCCCVTDGWDGGVSLSIPNRTLREELKAMLLSSPSSSSTIALEAVRFICF